MQNTEAFAANMTGMAEVFGVEMSPVKLMIYEKALGKFSDQEIQKAVDVAITTLKFFPKPVELIELIDGKPDERAVQAWGTLLETIQRHGAYRSVVFDDPKIASVVEMMGGWREVCTWRVEDTSMRGSQFQKLYRGLNGCRPENKTLIGVGDQALAVSGYGERIPPPVSAGGSLKNIIPTLGLEDV